MTSKPHSRDLFAIVHNALSNADLDIPDPFGGHETRAQIAKAVVALRSIEEQLEAVREQSGEVLEIREQTISDLQEQLEAARQIVRDLIECPNQDAPMHTAGGCSYCSAWQVENAANWLRASDRTPDGSLLNERDELVEQLEALGDSFVRWYLAEVFDDEAEAREEWEHIASCPAKRPS